LAQAGISGCKKMPKKKTPIWLTSLYVAGMLFTGSINTLTTKIQLELESTNIDGVQKPFRKPWFGTFNMLFAMALVLATERLFSAMVASFCAGPRMKMAEDALLEKPGGDKDRKRKIGLVAIPAASDLVATALATIGIIYIPASVWQMLRGATLFFTGIFSVTFLKRKLQTFHWIGLMLCMAGVVTVGYASVSGEEDDAGKEDGASSASTSGVLFGVVITLLGQVVQAAQVILEEFLMKDVDLPAVEIIGYEGIWGVLMMLVIVYPALYFIPGDDHGHQEDIVDTMVMFSNSSALQMVVLVYIFSCGTFNITGIAVTGALSAVHRMMLDASRTMIIWSIGLFIHYKIDPTSKFGEQWTSSSSLQLGGFVILMTGQAIYGQIFRIPGLQYRSESVEDLAQFASPSAALHFASPAVGPG